MKTSVPSRGTSEAWENLRKWRQCDHFFIYSHYKLLYRNSFSRISFQVILAESLTYKLEVFCLCLNTTKHIYQSCHLRVILLDR